MSLDDLGRDWETLAREDPLWAVYVRADTKDGGWDLDEFLATGTGEIARSQDQLARLGRRIGGTVVDFGCGVGRLSRALSTESTEVVGVDIAPSMLARAHDICSDRPNVRFVLGQDETLPLPDASADVVYTSLVLQHMPRDLALGYVRDFLRVLRPGGLAVLQVAVSPRLSLKGLAFRVLPASWYAQLQRRLLRYPAPMRMESLRPEQVDAVARPSGGRVLDVSPDETYGGHWTYARVVVEASGPPAPATVVRG